MHYAMRRSDYQLIFIFLIPVLQLALTSTAAAAVIEFFDRNQFSAAAASITVSDFDSFAARSVLTGSEIPGFTVMSRRITVVDPQDFAPGLIVGGANVNSQPHGISASLSYSGTNILFDNGDDNFTFRLSTPTTAAGLWLGNLGASNNDPTTATTVSFFDQTGALLAQESLTQSHVGLIGSGANNRIFYGITSVTPIGSFSVSNAASDGDGIVLDDVQFGSAVPEPTFSLTLFTTIIGAWMLRRRIA